MEMIAEQKTAESYLSMLYALSKEARLYVLSKLTDSLLREEIREKTVPSHSRRAKVIRRSSVHSLTDSELEKRFADKNMPDYPESEPTWSEVINANSGKTIKPVEKWL